MRNSNVLVTGREKVVRLGGRKGERGTKTRVSESRLFGQAEPL